MTLPATIQSFIDQKIERLAAPLCIEYDERFCLIASSGPTGRYGLLDMLVGDLLPESLDFIQSLNHDEPLSLSFVTLPTGVVAHINLLQCEQRHFVVLFDATEQHGLVQTQQQQANELRLLNHHQQQTLEQLRTAKAAIEEQRSELEVLHQAQTRFIAMMSHEFRTPINAIMGYASLLSEDGAPADRVGAIRRAAWHLLTMVENVLEQARLGRDQVTITREPTTIAELINLTRDLFQEQARERGLSLRVSQSPGIPEQLMLDVMRIRQVTINLVGNALRYTSKGEVNITFAYQEGSLKITVQDSGPGISSADQERIFRPYERGTGSPGGGAGLGLAICRQLAEAMAGSLTLQSQPGRGSRFLFQVPATIPDKSPLPPLSGHVLVLDDDPDLRQWLQILLQDWGLEPTVLSSLEELQQWLQEHRSAADMPELLLTDYLLEDGVGVTAMKLMRDIDGELPVVMLTGSVPAEEGARMTYDPNFMLLAKPISATALRYSLNKMLLHSNDNLSLSAAKESS